MKFGTSLILRGLILGGNFVLVSKGAYIRGGGLYSGFYGIILYSDFAKADYCIRLAQVGLARAAFFSLGAILHQEYLKISFSEIKFSR